MMFRPQYYNKYLVHLSSLLPTRLKGINSSVFRLYSKASRPSESTKVHKPIVSIATTSQSQIKARAQARSQAQSQARKQAQTTSTVRAKSNSLSYQKTWDLPQLSEDGTVINQDLKRIKEVGNRVGALIDNRPKVPPNWRSDKTLQPWQRQVFALREKFHNEGWKPKKRLSRRAMEGIRKLREFEPTLSSRDIAREFKVSPESIRRILKSKWRPNVQEEADITERWRKRGEKLLSMNRPTDLSSNYSPKKTHQSRKMRYSQSDEKPNNDIGDEFF